VNECFLEHLHRGRTSLWIHWLDQPPPKNYEMALDESWLPEAFLNSGADLSEAEDMLTTPITVLVGRRITGNSLEETSIKAEDGGFNVSHPFFKDDLVDEILRSSYKRVRRLLREIEEHWEENVEVDPVPSTSPIRDCDEKSGRKRHHGKEIQDEEHAYESGPGRHQTKRQRTFTELDVETRNQLPW